MRTPFLLSLALALSACAVEEAPPESGTLFAPVPGGSLPPPGGSQNCDDFGCGKNTAAVGATVFHELHQALSSGRVVSQYNDDGVRILSAYDKYGRRMRLEVTKTTLRGILLQAPYSTIGGADLEGATIELYDRTVGRTYTIHHAGIGTIETWVAPIQGIETHYFRVDEGDGVFRDLCKAVDFAHGDEELAAWSDLHVAIVYAGDRYDRHEKTVTATGATTQGWFNIGCAGTVLPKLVLNRLTTATSDLGHKSTPSQRQAALRAITATYCPENGLSYTHDGVALDYTNAPHWMDFSYGDIDSLEAVWDENGPVCLATPRLEGAYDILDLVDADCGLPPPCSEVPLQWWEAGYFLTTNPS